MGQDGNVITELTTDHRKIDALFEQIELQPVGDQRRRQLADELTVELVQHSVAEEQYLYPSVRRFVDGGDDLADKEIEDHARVEQLLKDLEGRDAEDDQFDHLVAKLRLEVAEHVRDEENRLFPLLAEVCTPEALEHLGGKIRDAKKAAPTHPHPAAPDTAPANKILGPGIGLVDRVRDLLAGRNR
ncbi:hemerythrin domain-containing protein [Streptomyces sp. NPDC002088]|uniref:hemerythrin domain-containing protein n=1 Tax=Streptomyces sp. NPDC002088 TaxID=3154665 RepID=UPI00332336C4